MLLRGEMKGERIPRTWLWQQEIICLYGVCGAEDECERQRLTASERE